MRSAEDASIRFSTSSMDEKDGAPRVEKDRNSSTTLKELWYQSSTVLPGFSVIYPLSDPCTSPIDRL